MDTRRIRSVISDLHLDLRALALFRQRVPSMDVGAQLRDRLARREEHFLAQAERLIFANYTSPYRPLLEIAGYDWPALRQLVLTRGLDVALDQLAAAGMYVRIQEFKGMEPVVRGGRTLRFQERDFVNLSVRAAFQTQSSGSRSQGTPTGVGVEDFHDGIRLRRWLFQQYGVADREVVIWQTGRSGLRTVAQFTLIGPRPPLRWLCLTEVPRRSDVVVSRLARLLTGQPIPAPEAAPPSRAVEVARAISRLGATRRILVFSLVNSALRLVVAAEEAGVSLGDVVFFMGGEPLTPRKHHQFAERGFPVYSGFAFSEFGSAASTCAAAREPDDLHVLTDRLALRQYRRAVDHDGTIVDAYLFTSLLPHTRRVMVNVESGDYGGLEVRRCGCFLDQTGFHLHMHTIRSFEKLKAEGMTYLGPGLITLLEEELPSRFGGDSQHYQLVEAEDDRGFTRLYLLVSPRVGPIDEEAVRLAALQTIVEGHLVPRRGETVRRVWEAAETVRVLRREPLLTTTGKILHLHRSREALDIDAPQHVGKEARR